MRIAALFLKSAIDQPKRIVAQFFESAINQPSSFPVPRLSNHSVGVHSPMSWPCNQSTNSHPPPPRAFTDQLFNQSTLIYFRRGTAPDLPRAGRHPAAPLQAGAQPRRLQSRLSPQTPGSSSLHSKLCYLFNLFWEEG